MALQLTPTQRRYLRGLAHHVQPTVMVGQHGLTPSVIAEAGHALAAHELIKIRVLGDDRALRVQLIAELCAALDCAEVQHIGKLLVLYRPKNEPKIVLPK